MIQCVERGLGQQWNGAAVAVRQARDDGSGQLRQVAAAFAQRRHAQFDHVDAVVQIVSKTAVGDQVAQVLVGGRQDAYVHQGFAGGADRTHRFFLDGAQQLDLHLQRQFGHFVQEQGAAVRGLE